MREPIEIIASNGDRWVGRECDDDDNCVVIERFICRDADATADEGMPSDEPTHDLHIPWQIFKAIAVGTLDW